MPEKTPRELLHESLNRNAKELAALPDWVRAAISTESIFKVNAFDSSRSDHATDNKQGQTG